MDNKSLKYLLDYDPRKTISKSGMLVRKLIHPLFMQVVKIPTKSHLHIVRRENAPKNRPIIYAACHSFVDDIACSLLTIKKPVYFLLGSLPQFFGSVDGIAAWANGVILIDRMDKKSRKSSKLKMQRYMDLGGNLLMFPEGVWNRTPNLPILKLFPGIYQIAKYSNAIIVPVATHQVGKDVYSILGSAIDITDKEQTEALQIVRDAMATLKWELMETYSKDTRQNMLGDLSPTEYWLNYIEQLISEADFYDRDLENNVHFIDKNETSYLQAFEHLDHLIPCKENAFLFRNPIDKETYGRQANY